MNQIKKLDQKIISKVAAGEVVEHPVSVIKELIENSIDAKATKIEINLTNSGFDKIAITDNGTGMTKTDLLICIDSHTTSKITTEKDLYNIYSLGFRGEALHSIANVSKTTVMSKTKEGVAGYQIQVEGGVLIDQKPLGMNQGTIVIVKELFYNQPARKKFFDTPQSEFRKILQSITSIAICYPKISFVLKHNNKIVLHLPKNQTLKNRLEHILSETTVEKLVRVQTKDENFTISGFTSKPQLSYTNKQNQYIYVNNRYVLNKKISAIIKDMYGNLLEPHSYPLFVLFIEANPQDIDVNIHPKKLQVEFSDEKSLLKLIQQGLQQSLGYNDLTYQVGQSSQQTQNEFNPNFKPRSNQHLASELKIETNLWNIKTNKTQTKIEEVLQVNNLYLVVNYNQDILIFDQHAAHEKILYEQYLQTFFTKKNKNEILPYSKIIDLPINLQQILNDYSDTLNELGFKIEHFRKNQYKITQIPKIFEKHNMSQLLNELLSQLQEFGYIKQADQKSLQTISYLACRTAIKAGDFLTKKERLNIVKKLFETDSNYTCPHGRPLKIQFTKSELEKMFKRRK